MALRLIGALALASGSPGVSLLELKTRMLNAYGDKMLRPGLASMSSCVAEPPTDTIQIQYTVTSYADLDQRLQRFTFDGDFDIFWYDPRLVYNATECTGMRFYHWGALAGFIGLLDAGFYQRPRQEAAAFT